MSRTGISVAMCTFNGYPFLGTQLESIAAQTRLPDELVICDDRSSDNSVETIRDFASTSAFPVRLVINEKNQGSTRNFEKAIALCRGTIVVLADQDDLWYPYKLDRLERVFLQSSATVAAFSDSDLIDGESRSTGQRFWQTVGFNAREQLQCNGGQALHVLLRHPVVTGATMAFRKELQKTLFPIPPSQIHDRWISFLLAVCGPLTAIEEPLMAYRRHSHQQIGPGPQTVLEKMDRVKNTGAGFYANEIIFYRLLYEKLETLQQHIPAAQEARARIERKLAHLAHRVHLRPSRALRVPQILRESLNGNYWHYSGGWKSIAKDCILR